MLSFEAGLATGLSHFLAPGLVLLGVVTLALPLRRASLGWLPIAMLLGFGLGSGARGRLRQTCAARLPAASLDLTIRLLEPVQEGVAGATVADCRGAITTRIRADRLLPAGSILRVTGRWIPTPRLGGRPDGILVTQRYRHLPSHPGPLDRLRTWLAHTTRQLYGARAGLVDALLVGRRGGIDPVLNAEFARSGLVHLLSISGFHVGIIFAWTVALLRLARLGRGTASAAGAVLVTLYVLFLGWPPPAARAAVLCLLVAWSTARQRQPSAGALLAVTALVVTLFDPWAIFDLGGWLSLAALSGAAWFTRWSDRALGSGAGWRMLFASLGATLATAPLTAAALGAVALAGIGLNFVAIPLAALAVPAVLASVLAAPLLSPLSGALAAGGGLGLAGLEALARTGSRLPGAAIVTVPGIRSALPWLSLLGLALWIMGRRNTSKRAVLRLGWVVGVTGCAALLPVGALLAPHEGPGLSLHFLSVGQGDAALIRTPAGHWILVDAGPADDRRDAGRDVILPFLVRHGVRRLSALVLSHAHLDHSGGAVAVLRQVPADLILEPAEPVAEPHYLALLDLAAARGMRWRPARVGDSLVLDGVRLSVLHPDTTWPRWRADLNDDSVVLLIRYRSFEAVLAGDLGFHAESLVAHHLGRVDLLKVGHHGSAGSSGAEWLTELAPRAAIVSVGPNRYGHPAASALARIAGAGAEVWRTDRDGTVTVTVEDSTMLVRGRRQSRVYRIRP